MSFSEWKKYKMGDVATKIGSGATPKGGKETYLDEGEYALIRSQNVLDFSFSYVGLAFINEEQANKLNNVILEEEDVLLNITGDSVARVCQVPNKLLPARVNQHVAIIRPDKKILNNKFLKYYLLNPSFKTFLLNISSVGATRNAITKGMIESLEITIPSLKIQLPIASILSSLDDKIELNRQTNQTLEAIAQTLFKEMCLPKGDELPEGWRVGKLGEIMESKGGTTPSTKNEEYWNGEFNWATPKDLSNLKVPVLLSTERLITEKGLKQISSGLLPKGTLLMSSRAPIGYFAISQIPISINQGFIAMNGISVSNLFLLHWLRLNIEIVKSMGNGSTFLEISKSVFRNIEIVIPSKSILQKFENIVKPIFDNIISNEQEIQTLTILRDSLLPKLMKGEIKV